MVREDLQTTKEGKLFADLVAGGRFGGLPLLRPSIPETNASADSEIQLADVGYLDWRDGTFRRLFNAALPGDHSINKGRVPPSYQPMDMDGLSSLKSSHDIDGTATLTNRTSANLSPLRDESPLSSVRNKLIFQGQYNLAVKRWSQSCTHVVQSQDPRYCGINTRRRSCLAGSMAQYPSPSDPTK